MTHALLIWNRLEISKIQIFKEGMLKKKFLSYIHDLKCLQFGYVIQEKKWSAHLNTMGIFRWEDGSIAMEDYSV